MARRHTSKSVVGGSVRLRRAAAATVEAVERRVLFSGAPAQELFHLDAAATAGIRFDREPVEALGKYFLVGRRSNNNGSLYVTSGTGDATLLMSNLSQPETPDAGLGFLTVAGGKVYFFASTPVNATVTQTGLYTTDGTIAGTTLVKGLLAPAGQSTLGPIFELGGKLGFFWSVSGQTQLWTSDGTTASTASAWTEPAAGFEFPQTVSPEIDGHVYFGETNSLWRTDGTTTSAVYESGALVDLPVGYAATASRFFFTRADAAGRKIYVGNRDGTGLSQLAIPSPAGFQSFADSVEFTVVGDKVLFMSENPQTHAMRLFSTDGTAAGTSLLLTTAPNDHVQLPVRAGAGRAVFVVTSATPGQAGMWVTDGTAAGTQQGAAFSASVIDATGLFAAAGHAFLRDPVPTNTGIRFYESDGTLAGTHPVHYLTPPTTRFASTFVLNSSFQGRPTIAGALDDGFGTAIVWSLDPDVHVGSIAGVPYVDANRDGTRQGFEQKIGASSTVYLDLNGNGFHDPTTEPAARPTADGGYLIDGLPPDATYTVRYRIAEAGWTVAQPAGGSYTVALQPDQHQVGLDFAIVTPSPVVWGTVFQDADADGVKDPAEGAPATPQTLYIDLNNNGNCDAPGEPSTVSAADGTYGFTLASAGTYTVRRLGQAGWRQTVPANGGGVTVTAVASGAVAVAPIGVAPVPPMSVTASAYDFASAVPRVRFTFDADVSLASLTSSNSFVTVAPAAGGGASIRFAPAGYDAATRTITFAAPAGTGSLADGNYVATLASGAVAAVDGNLTAGDVKLSFFVLAGDANRDRTVGPEDFNVLASHFGQSGQTWATGDFNHDGVVGPEDFNVLASRFGTTLAPPPAPLVVTSPPAAAVAAPGVAATTSTPSPKKTTTTVNAASPAKRIVPARPAALARVVRAKFSVAPIVVDGAAG